MLPASVCSPPAPSLLPLPQSGGRTELSPLQTPAVAPRRAPPAPWYLERVFAPFLCHPLCFLLQLLLLQGFCFSLLNCDSVLPVGTDHRTLQPFGELLPFWCCPTPPVAAGTHRWQKVLPVAVRLGRAWCSLPTALHCPKPRQDAAALCPPLPQEQDLCVVPSCPLPCPQPGPLCHLLADEDGFEPRLHFILAVRVLLVLGL